MKKFLLPFIDKSFSFSPKNEYKLAAERSEVASSGLRNSNRRRRWDSNPQAHFWTPVFKTGGITNYPTPPIKVCIFLARLSAANPIRNKYLALSVLFNHNLLALFPTELAHQPHWYANMVTAA